MRLLLQVTVTLALLAAFANAYPDLYVDGGLANGCTDHPTRGYAGHGKPVADKATTFTLTAAGSTAPAAALCPGISYAVTVDYGSSSRRTLLTSSLGELAGSTDPTCPTRSYTASDGAAASTYQDTLTLPCTATGSVSLQVTSAAGSSDTFHSATTSMPVTLVAQCPGSTCPGAPAAAAAAAKPAAAAAKPAAKPAAAATPAATPADEPAPAAAADATPAGLAAPVAATGSKAAAGSSGCQVSQYGYACKVPAGGGAMLHYTSGGSQPDNACTKAAGAASNTASSDPGNQPVHFLLESPLAGYAGLSFPAKKGAMSPADAVIGSVDAATGKPTVSAYHLTDYSPQPSATNFNAAGWASSMGAGKDGGKTLLCFTRPTTAPNAAVVKTLDLKALNMNWAADGSTDFVTHQLQGGITLNTVSGQAAAGIGSDTTDTAAILAHGALMLCAFIGLMPLGGLMARHKWIFGNKQAGGIRGHWFIGHRAVQLLAVVVALAGFILALVVADTPWDLSKPAPHPLYDLHRLLGVVVMGFVVLQAAGGFARPGLATRRRPLWRFGHLGLGWLTITLAIIVVFVGAVLMHDLKRQPWLNWMLPIGLVLGLLVVVGIATELPKLKLERSGVYHPPSHTFVDPAIVGKQVNGCDMSLTGKRSDGLV